MFQRVLYKVLQEVIIGLTFRKFNDYPEKEYAQAGGSGEHT